MNEKDEILKIYFANKKHYQNIIPKKYPDLYNWIMENSLIKDGKFSAHMYSAIYQHPGVCEYGNQMKFTKFSIGFVGCGHANKCQCTKENSAKKGSKTKLNFSKERHQEINKKREETMQARYGYSYNSQRPEVKLILRKPKMSSIAHSKLTDFNWLNEEYNIKKRTLVDIADELKVYYSTVAEYCKKFDFKIRQVARYSLEERQIAEYIRSLGVVVVENDWDTLITQEIDILIPSYNLGIEMNGLRWHSWHPSTGKLEDKFQHINKTVRAKEQGIQLLHITDYEWHYQQDIVKSLIKTKLGLNNKISARKCTIGLVDTNTTRTFLENNHFQGFVGGTEKYGLYFENTLVMLMVVGKSRFNKEIDYELLRVCTIPGITVVGGVSKLLANFKRMHPGEILVSYCDLDKSMGNSYFASGFELLKITNPGYFWTDSNNIINRGKTRKTELSKLLPNFDSSLTERENMFNNNYRIFWNCGNAVFLLK